MASIIPLASAAAVYPTLLAGVIVLLARDKPAPLLASFLAGGYVISIAAGLIIVFVLDGTVSASNQKSASATVDLIAGVLSLVLAGVLWKRAHDKGPAQAPESKKDGKSWTQRALGQGSWWVAFGAGVVLNLPGIWYLDALKDIAQANASTVTSIVWVLLFVVIMFMLAELPLIGFAVDPDRTRVRVQRFERWMNAHARTIEIVVAAAIGMYLTVKGIADIA